MLSTKFRKFIPQAVPDFFESHKSSLPIIGFLIVFATFVAHDYFREDAKDLADSLSRAKDAITLRQEIASQERILTDTHEKVNRLYRQAMPSDAIKKTEIELKSIGFWAILYDYYSNYQVRDQRLVEEIKDLRRHLPKGTAFTYAVEPIEAALKKRGDMLKQLHADIFDATHPDPEPIYRLIKQMDDQKVPMKFLNTLPNIEPQLAVEWLADDTFRVADQSLSHAEAISHFWRSASLWLYFAGFVLGLGGRLFGVKMD